MIMMMALLYICFSIINTSLHPVHYFSCPTYLAIWDSLRNIQLAKTRKVLSLSLSIYVFIDICIYLAICIYLKMMPPIIEILELWWILFFLVTSCGGTLLVGNQ